MLAGSIATLLGWAKTAEKENRLYKGGPPPQLLAAFAGCLLTRRFAAHAFTKEKRSMTAPDLIEAIGYVFEKFSPADCKGTKSDAFEMPTLPTTHPVPGVGGGAYRWKDLGEIVSLWPLTRLYKSEAAELRERGG